LVVASLVTTLECSSITIFSAACVA